MRQREAFHFIHRWCQNTVKSKKTGTLPDPFHIFISGGAGTGKSHLIRALYHMCVKTLRQAGDDPSLIPVLLTSPTGTAAFNIGGMTLHSAFHLDFGKGETKLSDDKRNTLRTNLSALRIVVIDEISMVGISLFNNLNSMLKNITGSMKPFGGVSILALGDLYQLPPVGQSFIFKQPNASLDQFTNNIWVSLFNCVELTEIMRQKGDEDFAQLLNRIKTVEKKPYVAKGDKSTTNIDRADFDLLSSRILPEELVDPASILHAFAINEQVDAHNTKILNTLNKRIQTLTAIDIKPPSMKSFGVPDDARHSGGLLSKIKIAIGCRVMLVRNLDVADGLVNGAQGIVSEFIFPRQLEEKAEDDEELFPSVVIVKSDDAGVGQETMKRSGHDLTNFRENSVPIERMEVKIKVTNKKSSPEIMKAVPT